MGREPHVIPATLRLPFSPPQLVVAPNYPHPIPSHSVKNAIFLFPSPSPHSLPIIRTNKTNKTIPATVKTHQRSEFLLQLLEELRLLGGGKGWWLEFIGPLNFD